MSFHLQKMVDKLKSENEQLHLTISRLTEAHQEEMKKQIGYLQHKVDQLTDMIKNYDAVITVHNKLGGK